MSAVLPVFITARLGSTRLPEKHLLPLRGDRAAMRCLIDRLRGVGLPLVLCIPDDPADARLAMVAHEEGIDAFAGDPENVLARYHQALTALDRPAAIIVDGDDVFVSTTAIREMARTYDGHDLIQCLGLPYGGAPFLLSRDFLARMLEADITPHGWSRYLAAVEGRKATLDAAAFAPEDRALRLSLDYPEDLDFLRYLYAHAQRRGTLELEDVVAFIRANHAAFTARFPSIFDGTLAARAAADLAHDG